MVDIVEPVTSTVLFAGLAEGAGLTYASALSAYTGWVAEHGFGTYPGTTISAGAETQGLAANPVFPVGSGVVKRYNPSTGFGLHFADPASASSLGTYDPNVDHGPFMPGFLPDEPPTFTIGVSNTSHPVPMYDAGIVDLSLHVTDLRRDGNSDNPSLNIGYMKVERQDGIGATSDVVWELACRTSGGKIELVVTCVEEFAPGTGGVEVYVMMRNYTTGFIAGVEYLGFVSEGETKTFSTPGPATIEETVTENLSFSSDQQVGLLLETTLTQGIGFAATPLRSLISSAAETEALAIGAVAGFKWYPGAHVVERLQVGSSARGAGTYGMTLSEVFGILGGASVAYPVQVVEAVGLTDLTTVQVGVFVLERLGVHNVVQALGAYGVTVRDTFRLRDALLNFLGAEVVESLGLGDAVTAPRLLRPAVVELLGFEDVISPQLLLSVTVSEDVAVGAEQALGMLFSPTIVEGIGISVGVLEPNGSITTWVLNTRTTAVTEYRNFDFNSFARMGPKYIGAASTGLYELNGDDDAGDEIVSSIRSGMLKFNEGRLMALHGAYIAMKGPGSYILRLIAGDGRTFDYAVATRDGRQTKIKMGKGLRANYFAFELIGLGEDFDLDTIEFVPLWPTRRV